MIKDGFYLLDKPKGISSFQLVRELRKKIGEKKIGHSGTLDPFATGLMILAVNKGTKLLEYLIGHKKEYIVTAHFGFKSDSFDEDGEIIECDYEGKGCLDKSVFVNKVLDEIEKSFLGSFLQVPPKYSALKINGKRACDLMREGENVVLKARKVEVFDFKYLDDESDWPFLKFKICVSAGTYIRSLINDLGENTGFFAYAKDLRRTKIADFSVEDAKTLENTDKEDILSVEEIAKTFDSFALDNHVYQNFLKYGALEEKALNFEGDGIKMAFLEGKFVGVLEKEKSKIYLRKRINL